MSAPAARWDFTPVINLLHSFKRSSEATDNTRNQCLSASGSINDDATSSARSGPPSNDSRKLGDFSTIWKFLSQDGSSPLGRADSNIAPSASDFHQNTTLLPDLNSLVSPSPNPVLLADTQTNNVILGSGTSISINDVSLDAREELTAKRQVVQILKNPDLPRIRHLTPPPELITHERDINSDPFINETPDLCLEPATKSPHKSKSPKVESKLLGTPAEKRADLVRLLCQYHTRQRPYLFHPNLCDATFVSSNFSPDGIHVFIDTSNLMVGFHDRIKIARDIPITVRVPRLPLSFHNLSLILERGRPIKKRVLAGSDRFPAIDEAEKLGYEANILARVHKTKKASSPRKKARDDKDTKDPSSGSDSLSKMNRKQWVEQAVDEILHLKMLESIVDTDEPSTIVLVTGDAAEAEFSGGFLKMVERALLRGWAVELVSFSCTISRAYTRKEFRYKWGSKFSIIELDRYAEYMLDM